MLPDNARASLPAAVWGRALVWMVTSAGRCPHLCRSNCACNRSLASSSRFPHCLRWQSYARLPRSPFITNTPSISPSQHKNKYIFSSVSLVSLRLILTTPSSCTSSRTLGDIWPHNDIPSIFLVNSIPSLSLTESPNLFIQPTTNSQHLLPSLPLILPSPFLLNPHPSRPCSVRAVADAVSPTFCPCRPGADFDISS